MMKTDFIVLVVVFSVNCGIAAASPNGAHKNTRHSDASENCGATIVFPGELSEGRNTSFPKCSQSYKASNGAVLSLAPSDSGPHDANWLERIPMLHTENIGLDDLINRNSTGIFVDSSRKVKIAPAPTECHLKTDARLSVITGPNWHGWFIEDSYRTIAHSPPSPKYCERYSKKNRCVRLVIGNLKASATMSQYCLTRDPKEFDHDGGLSYDIFYKIIQTMKFVDE
ncbi:conserved exported hypothetical protein [Paraburkholderia sacchari]|uniref:hypothetical protein n=1 Tax=Paraburkholderia sacchari TaxID=159450 RepID=UPI0039A757D3